MEFITPSKIIYGESALENAKEAIGELGEKALIVTGKHLIKTGEISKLTEVLDSIGITYEIYSGITGEPTDQMVEKGTQIYLEEKCDFLIGIGGGSPIDSMKAIALLSKCGGSCTDYMGKNITEMLPAMVAIPTTAGTGSEATTSTIITDTKTQVKMLLKGSAFMPTVAIVDARFSLTAPKSVTAHTGLDALTHAIEAYTSVKAGALSDTFAISAVKRIFQNLSKVYEDGSDLLARNEMAIAALEAGIAFSNSSVTIVHGMSRPIGALYHVPHGLSNAMLLSTCLKYAVSGTVSRFADLGRAIGLDGENDTVIAKEFIEKVETLCSECQVMTLAEYGINQESFYSNISKMADDAITSGSPSNTRRNPSKDDIVKLYEELWAE